EIKDEMKELEGQPEVKQRIRAKQREMAQQRMLDDVPKADVVVTNPEHFAVALLYEMDKEEA
ncbi:MAG TPA: flagellar biosynthetic protein FlhB, partial [Gammaproteobacteria bacterium]|nr:flagellar biosynthetic protein FlhB [Gammaproteobacteria bacterium]